MLKLLRRRAWLIVLCALLVAASAFGFSKLQTKEYTATTALLFRNPGLAQQASGVAIVSQNDPQGQRDTNVRLVRLGDLARRTAAALRLGLTPSQIKDAVSVSPQGQSDVVSVSATSTSPLRAAQIANTLTQQFIDEQRAQAQATIQPGIDSVVHQYEQLTPAQRRTSQGQALLDRANSLKVFKAMQTGNAAMVERAAVPDSPSSPKVARNTVLGAVLGLLLGLGLAFLFERLDRRLREPEEMTEAFEAPALGVIPHGDWAPSVNGTGPGRSLPDLEPFLTLRANLRYFGVSRQVRAVLVTSVAPSEGKTVVAWSLATAAASMGTSTLLIEADLRRPSLSQLPGLRADVGLTTALVSGQPVSAAVQSVEVEGRTNGSGEGRKFDLLVAGPVPPNPAELLESDAMDQLLRWAAEHYALVVIDTPPLSVVADAVPLIKRVDGVIVVSRVGQSTRDGSRRLRERLSHLDAPVLGVVVNDVRRGGGEYGYGYGYRKATPSTVAGPD